MDEPKHKSSQLLNDLCEILRPLNQTPPTHPTPESGEPDELLAELHRQCEYDIQGNKLEITDAEGLPGKDFDLYAARCRGVNIGFNAAARQVEELRAELAEAREANEWQVKTIERWQEQEATARAKLSEMTILAGKWQMRSDDLKLSLTSQLENGVKQSIEEANAKAELRRQLDNCFDDRGSHWKAQAERLAVALQEGIERTQSEYCSHKGECSPDIPTCYVKDMLATLQQYRDGGRD